MANQIVRVECYSGYKADERPVRLQLGTRTFEVVAIEDRWYSPGATIFRVVADDGDRYVLRHEEAQDLWTLIAYRAAASDASEVFVDTKINQSV
ncbi:MAG TPA: hypothetical protein VH110_03785 [Candidatus Acidoferrum sp.]|jgi:hypothetical protein|nr:hypothetical protein [Candidatus Acidoferrum sp.]